MKAARRADVDTTGLADYHHNLEMQDRRAGDVAADNLAAAEQAASAEGARS